MRTSIRIAASIAVSIAVSLLLGSPLAAQDLPRIGWSNGAFKADFYPSLDAGTQVNRVGFLLRDVGRFEAHGLSWGAGGFISAKAAAGSLGIAGPGLQASCGLDGILGFGAPSSAPAPWTDFAIRRSREIRYEWISYWDSWGTAQFNGRLEYVWTSGDHSFGFAMQDDLFSPPFRDEYRTGAAELSYGFDWRGVDSALGLGTKIWTGSTYGSGYFHRGEVIVMNSALPGVNDSAGVLYLAVRRGAVRLELGWDSEAIRNVLQNGLHWLIDDGIVPLVDRPDRPYFLLTLYPDGDLY
ncbi:MAG TPA: polymorphic toxin type 23 domain-containing protein [Rectinemataceae bacterium]|nr:polymorphic toxin type 23 domain-containing protein [Rectinemataceae bacterium]